MSHMIIKFGPYMESNSVYLEIGWSSHDYKSQSIYGKQLLQDMLLKYIYITKTDYSIVHFSNDKPYIKSNKKIYFNISHSFNCVICAVASTEVGVDVQKVTNIKYELFTGKIIYKEEYNYIGGVSLINFYRLWCAKEAYLKYVGIGINDFSVFNTFSVIFNDGKNYYEVMNDKTIIIKEFIIRSNYIIAICMKKKSKLYCKSIHF